MEKTTAQRIVEAAEVIGGMDLELREDYSGRGMFGSETFAVVGDSSDFMAAVAYAAGCLGQENPDQLDEFCEDVRGLRSDSMGRSSQVWY